MKKIVIAALALAACQDPTPVKTRTARGQEATSSVGDRSRGSERIATAFGDLYEGVFCNDTTEGIGWCDDDVTLAYCSLGTWWLLDCTDVGGDYCNDDGITVDCYVY